MKQFLNSKKHLLYAFGFVLICLLPTIVLSFYSNREFVDAGLLITAILFVSLVIPIVKQINLHLESKKK